MKDAVPSPAALAPVDKKFSFHYNTKTILEHATKYQENIDK